MNKYLTNKIAYHYYTLGSHAANEKIKEASVKDVARTLGQISSYTLPTIGAATGVAAGGYYGGAAGLSIAEALANAARQSGDTLGEAATALLGAPLLGGAGLGLGAGLGGLGGYQLGSGAKDAILQALNKSSKQNLYRKSIL